LLSSMNLNKRRKASSIAYWWISRSWIALPHFFWIIEPAQRTRMSDLGSQPKEVWKQPGRLPAEGRLGSSENTRNSLFCCLLGPLCIYATCLAFGAYICSIFNWTMDETKLWRLDNPPVVFTDEHIEYVPCNLTVREAWASLLQMTNDTWKVMRRTRQSLIYFAAGAIAGALSVVAFAWRRNFRRSKCSWQIENCWPKLHPQSFVTKSFFCSKAPAKLAIHGNAVTLGCTSACLLREHFGSHGNSIACFEIYAGNVHLPQDDVA
jgi:hypothetical protein